MSAPDVPASPDPLIAGTLALLSHYARTQHLGAAQKIARNLALLAQHPGVSPPLSWTNVPAGRDRRRELGSGRATAPAVGDRRGRGGAGSCQLMTQPNGAFEFRHSFWTM